MSVGGKTECKKFEASLGHMVRLSPKASLHQQREKARKEGQSQRMSRGGGVLAAQAPANTLTAKC